MGLSTTVQCIHVYVYIYICIYRQWYLPYINHISPMCAMVKIWYMVMVIHFTMGILIKDIWVNHISTIHQPHINHICQPSNCQPYINHISTIHSPHNGSPYTSPHLHEISRSPCAISSFVLLFRASVRAAFGVRSPAAGPSCGPDPCWAPPTARPRTSASPEVQLDTSLISI